MDATTTAVFNATGISATSLTTFLQTIFGQALSFSIYVIETIWPFLLVVMLFGILVGIGYMMMHRRH
jgi:hypothetical protein